MKYFRVDVDFEKKFGKKLGNFFSKRNFGKKDKLLKQNY